MDTIRSASSTNALPLSGPNSTALQRRKLSLANQARLLMDNQRILDMTAADNQVYRQQVRRSLEAQMSELQPGAAAAQAAPIKPDDGMGDILIDSPTVNHNYPAVAPKPSASAGWIWPAITAAILGIGGTAAVLLRPNPTPTTAPPAVTKPADPAVVKPLPTGDWVIQFKDGKATWVFEPYVAPKP